MKVKTIGTYNPDDLLIKSAKTNYDLNYMCKVQVCNGNKSNPEFTDFMGTLFYQANPDTKAGHSHYAVFYWNDFGELLITNGQPTVDLINECGIIGYWDGETFHYSSHRHDFVRFDTPNGSVAIDGGRNYLRIVGTMPQLHKATITDDYFKIEVL